MLRHQRVGIENIQAAEKEGYRGMAFLNEYKELFIYLQRLFDQWVKREHD